MGQVAGKADHDVLVVLVACVRPFKGQGGREGPGVLEGEVCSGVPGHAVVTHIGVARGADAHRVTVGSGHAGDSLVDTARTGIAVIDMTRHAEVVHSIYILGYGDGVAAVGGRPANRGKGAHAGLGTVEDTAQRTEVGELVVGVVTRGAAELLLPETGQGCDRDGAAPRRVLHKHTTHVVYGRGVHLGQVGEVLAERPRRGFGVGHPAVRDANPPVGFIVPAAGPVVAGHTQVLDGRTLQELGMARRVQSVAGVARGVVFVITAMPARGGRVGGHDLVVLQTTCEVPLYNEVIVLLEILHVHVGEDEHIREKLIVVRPGAIRDNGAKDQATASIRSGPGNTGEIPAIFIGVSIDGVGDIRPGGESQTDLA